MSAVRPQYQLAVVAGRPLAAPADIAAFAEAAGLPAQEVRARCGGGGVTVIARDDHPARLESARDALRALGHGAAVVPERDISNVGYPLACRSLEIGSDGARFLDVDGGALAEMPRCAAALLIVAAPAFPPERPASMSFAPAARGASAGGGDTAAVARFDARRASLAAEKRLTRLLMTGLEHAAIDLAWEGGSDRIRISGGRFRFESLGALAAPSVAANMRTLVEQIAGLAASPILDVDFGSLTLARAVRHAPAIQDGRPLDRPRDRDEEEFEQYARFLHAAWRGGLFDARTRVPRAAGQRYVAASASFGAHAEAAATAGARAPRPTLAEISVTAGAIQSAAAAAAAAAAATPGGGAPSVLAPAAAVSAGVALTSIGSAMGAAGAARESDSQARAAAGARDRAAEASPDSAPHAAFSAQSYGESERNDVPGIARGVAADLLAKSRRLGPALFVIPLAIGAIAAGTIGVLAPSRLAWGVALLASGLLALSHAIALFARKRTIENIPTSRIRSAAMGLCEIQGKARALTPMNTPFSQMPCVYFEFQLVERDGDASARQSWSRRGERASFGGVTLMSASAEASARPARVITGSSGDVPFLVEDDTGVVEVDPRGAIIHVSSTQTLHNPPFGGAMITPGANVTIRETYIPVGHPLYVLGELRQIVPDVAQRREAISAHLAELKRDPARMAGLDANTDGAVDAEEWEIARREVERLWHAAEAGPDGRSDRVVMGRPLTSDLFFISERSESRTVAAFGRRALWSALLGIALSAFGSALLWRAASLAGAAS